MKNDEKYADVRFELVERSDRTWDLIIFDKDGGKVTGIGPLSWDDVVKQCNIFQRLRHDFINQLCKGDKTDDKL